MNKFISLFLVLVYPFLLINAQSEEVIPDFELSTQWTNPKVPAKGKRISDSYLLKNDGDEIYYIYNAGIPPEKPRWGDYIVKQNLETNEFINKKIELEKTNGIKPDFILSEVLNNDIYVFSFIKNKKEQKYTFLAHKVNQTSLELEKEQTVIYEISSQGLLKDADADLLIKLSPDKKSVAILYSILDKKSSILASQLVMYDSNLEKKNNFDLFGMGQLGIEGKVYTSSIAIDNDANTYVLFVNEGDDRRGLFINKYSNILNGPLALTKKITFRTDYYPTGAILGINNKNEMVCTGFYKNKESNDNTGVFSFTASQDFTKTNIIETPYDVKYLPIGASDRDKERVQSLKSRAPKGATPIADTMLGYRFSDILFLKDGSYAVVAEKSQATKLTIRNRSSKMTNSYLTYQFNDIVVSIFNADGSVKNLYYLDEDVNTNFSTHFKASFVTGTDNEDNIHLFTTDLNTDIVGAITDLSEVMYYKFAKNGSLSKYKLFTGNEGLTKQFTPLLSVGLGNGNFILTALDYGGSFIGQTKMSFTKVHLD